jgi:hypothetical protein
MTLMPGRKLEGSLSLLSIRAMSRVTSSDESIPNARMSGSPCPERSIQKSIRKSRMKR